MLLAVLSVGCFRLSWLVLAVSWLLLAAPGCSWLVPVPPGWSWLLVAASGCCWLLLAAAPLLALPVIHLSISLAVSLSLLAAVLSIFKSACPCCSRFTKLSKMPALFQIYQVIKDARFVPDLLSYQRCPLCGWLLLGMSGCFWLLRGSVGCWSLSVCNAPVIHIQSRTLSTSLEFVFLWSVVLPDPCLWNDKSVDLHARRWCLHQMGLRAIGGG